MKDLLRPTPGRPGGKIRVVCGDEEEVVETSLSVAEARAKRSTTQPKNGMYACETCHSWWARDVNAAANMLWAFYAPATTGKRKVSSSNRQRTA